MLPVHATILPLSLTDNGQATGTAPPSETALEHAVRAQCDALIRTATACDPRGGGPTFFAFEQGMIPQVYALARLVLTLFLCVREQRERARTPERVEQHGRKFERRPAQPRNLSTFFGVVRYFRTYLHGAHGHGFHPVDVALGLTTDRLSLHLLSLAARLATTLSFALVHKALGWFVGAAPSTEVIEHAVLGLGRRTQAWFERAPAPADDGEILVMMVDSKGAPTATESELQRRRGPRRPNPFPNSPRHRGRACRAHYGSKPRRRKGDKSKNAKMATLVVMYTLRRMPGSAGQPAWLQGPINRRVYASFAPKRHAFEIARREADKRGFTAASGKLIQIVMDGDQVLTDYAHEYFPDALLTVDVIHVLEYLWTAAECLYHEGSTELATWIETQKERLYGGREREIVAELKCRWLTIPLTGPGNKGRRARLAQAIGYVEKRLPQMNYHDLRARDLELGSGAAEGAVKNVIGARFDFGGMRWIRERAEALLQLRCIEANGDWEAFITWVHDATRQQALATGELGRFQERLPGPLPTLAEAA